MSLLFAGLTFSVYNMLHHFKSHDEIQYITTNAKVQEDEKYYMFAFIANDENKQQTEVVTTTEV